MTDEQPRTLTDKQTSDLRSQLSSFIQDNTSEDANDLLDYALAMVTNGKSVEYIVNDLKNMGMDHICDEDASVKIGEAIDGFLNGNEGTSTTKRIISLKSKNENALTMSGALGSSKKDNKSSNALIMSGALGTSRDGTKKDKNAVVAKKKQQQQQQQKRNNGARAGNGRSIAAEAFKKLSQQRDDDMRHKRNDGRGRGGGRGRGRDSFRHDDRNNSGGRGRVDGPGRGGNRNSGHKRRHEESESRNYSEKSLESNHNHNRGGRDDFGGRGRGRGRGNTQVQNFSNEQNKRGRFENSNIQSSEEYNEGHQNEWHTGYHGGRGRGRGRGRGFGRGRSGESVSHESTLAAAEVSPSPLVAAEFGTTNTGPKLSYGGRGSFYRGGRGRGRGFPGRSHVAAMLAAKTWTRSNANENNEQEGSAAPNAEQAVTEQS